MEKRLGSVYRRGFDRGYFFLITICIETVRLHSFRRASVTRLCTQTCWSTIFSFQMCYVVYRLHHCVEALTRDVQPYMSKLGELRVGVLLSMAFVYI